VAMVPDCAALARIASWAASVTSSQGRLFSGVKVLKQVSQVPTLRVVQRMQAAKCAFFQPQWHVFHHQRVLMGQPGRVQAVFAESKSRAGGFRWGLGR